ncbi:MAG: hypothetical protein NTY09_03620 [bacterium]|nr:hypothetical protein [bacterium]
MEFVPIYNLGQEEAILQLYQNLELIGIDRTDLVITTLASVPDKIVIQGPRELIDIAKQILNTIDPPPQPPDPPPPELIDQITIRNLAPSDFAAKLDEVMNNFIGMVKLEPSADNFIVYARSIDGSGQITFYTPNMDTVTQAFIQQPLGYQGYQIYIRATTNEQALIASIKQIVATIDQPVTARSYKVLNVYYLQVDEAIGSLNAAGFNAVLTSAGTDPNALSALQTGQGPIIYSAPQVDTTSAELSSRFSENGSTSGIRGNGFTVLSFPDSVATTDTNRLIIFGTQSEIASVETYIALIDVPARQVLIEAQVIELNVDDLDDLGLRAISGQDDILSGAINPVFPGESSSSGPGGNFFTYDDSGAPQGNFQASLAALILDGRATVRARPKVVAVDGRQAIITIGRQVPVVQETLNPDDRSVFNISFVPVGITLNIKPRIGRGGEEVQMQVNAVVSNVETLNNVVSELSLVAPELATREVSTVVRIPNHQSLILGGLISTELETRTYKIPLLGDLPLIGSLFRRTREIRDRTEIIIVITPHVAEETEERDYGSDSPNPYTITDPYLIPLGSEILDNLDNVLFPGEYLIKQVDIRGINIVTGQPEIPADQIVPYSSNDPVMLTLLAIIRKLSLVDNLRMMSGIEIPADMDEVTARYHAEAFLIAYLRYLNSLDIAGISAGRRLLVPSFPIPGEGFEEPDLAWHSVHYLSITRANPILTGLAETIRWLDEQPEFDPYNLFNIGGSSGYSVPGPHTIDPVTGEIITNDENTDGETPNETGDSTEDSSESSGDSNG